MKKTVLVIVSSILLTACASTRPVTTETYTLSETLKLPYETAWQKTLQTLVTQGFSIDSSNQKGGVISIDEKNVRLDEHQAYCGTFHGISYLKDYRTATYLKLFIDLEKIADNATVIRINSSMKAAFNSGIGADTTYLTCYSSGDFEKHLLARIKN